MADLEDPDEILAGIRSDWPPTKAVNLILLSMYLKRIGRFQLSAGEGGTAIGVADGEPVATVDYDFAAVRERLREMAGRTWKDKATGSDDGHFALNCSGEPWFCECAIAKSGERIDLTFFVPLGEHL